MYHIQITNLFKFVIFFMQQSIQIYNKCATIGTFGMVAKS